MRRSRSAGPLPLSPVATTHHLSQTAFDRLKAEYDDLTTRGRIEIARKIETARELGDLSENGDYHAAKEEQGHMEGRIAHLGAMIENAEIVETPAGADTIHPGSIVALAYDGDPEPERFLVGSIEERGGDLDVISLGSPLGEALIGHKVGDAVEYRTPTGATLSVTIHEIEN